MTNTPQTEPAAQVHTPEAQAEPWYRRVMRWGQTNIREIDAAPEHYDVGWWVDHWRETRVQGVIVNAGGIVAYYPSALELHRRSPYLGERDLFGELSRAARDNGLVVVARMDSSRANERFYRQHPDWFAVDAAGQPYRAGSFGAQAEPFYTACIAGPYYREYLPNVLREICERYAPDGFSDNSWAGLGRNSGICQCASCRRSFAEFSGGLELPRVKDWDDPTYRRWIEWSYALRATLWALNNETTKRYGGPHCEWSGMNSGSLAGQSASFRDWRHMTSHARIIFLDFQGRHDDGPLWTNGEAGKIIRAVMGEDAPIPESMAMYHNVGTGGAPSFRLSAKPEPEVRLWFAEAVAGGIRPWWHHIGADHEDRRQFRTAGPLFTWHERHERYLRDRQHLAAVGVVYSQRAIDFFGRDDPAERCEAPLRGVGQALIRARIPYAMVHADLIPTAPDRYRVLVLPNVGALSDAQVQALRRYVAAGGGLLATGETSLYDEWGDRRDDFALGDLFGARFAGEVVRPVRGDRGERGASGAPARVQPAQRATREGVSTGAHTYLRIVSRPQAIRLAGAPGTPAFSAGWEETEHLPFGGTLVRTARRDGDTQAVEVPLTYIPPFPIYPPEFAYMLTERTDIPALYLRDGPAPSGRVAYLPADLDRTAYQHAQPDHLT
ncbi:MAG TPA: alpha-amylase family protein, partial [Chloroflexota bacterium]|nr:alpha-amylase family protein [Chloroflexota bacterium]